MVCLYWLALAPAMTCRAGSAASFPRTSSVIPSAKYASSGAAQVLEGKDGETFGSGALRGVVSPPGEQRAEPEQEPEAEPGGDGGKGAAARLAQRCRDRRAWRLRPATAPGRSRRRWRTGRPAAGASALPTACSHDLRHLPRARCGGAGGHLG